MPKFTAATPGCETKRLSPFAGPIKSSPARGWAGSAVGKKLGARVSWRAMFTDSHRRVLLGWAALALAVVLRAPAAPAASISASTAVVSRAHQERAKLCVSLDTSGAREIAGTENELVWDGECATMLPNGCSANSAHGKDLNGTLSRQRDFTYKALILSFSDTDPIDSGELYCCEFLVHLTRPGDCCQVRVVRAAGSDPQGNSISISPGAPGQLCLASDGTGGPAAGGVGGAAPAVGGLSGGDDMQPVGRSDTSPGGAPAAAGGAAPGQGAAPAPAGAAPANAITDDAPAPAAPANPAAVVADPAAGQPAAAEPAAPPAQVADVNAARVADSAPKAVAEAPPPAPAGGPSDEAVPPAVQADEVVPPAAEEAVQVPAAAEEPVVRPTVGEADEKPSPRDVRRGAAGARHSRRLPMDDDDGWLGCSVVAARHGQSTFLPWLPLLLLIFFGRRRMHR